MKKCYNGFTLLLFKMSHFIGSVEMLSKGLFDVINFIKYLKENENFNDTNFSG